MGGLRRTEAVPRFGRSSPFLSLLPLSLSLLLVLVGRSAGAEEVWWPVTSYTMAAATLCGGDKDGVDLQIERCLSPQLPHRAHVKREEAGRPAAACSSSSSFCGNTSCRTSSSPLPPAARGGGSRGAVLLLSRLTPSTPAPSRRPSMPAPPH
ncbi:Os03g0643900 [Oryza sativa Japonica Group]|uniref:Expressed protein n=2 Tax=Oryza sativa subsp. japonica TaxID=39947 RepID=Q10G52_ORYSJ|nr:expressed protein [Oryza sativa Japonica Group]EEE59578.1 hypothetical protein OsJ_11876 [Oryza sativa Japonica Group]KAB8092767.1 hypothetical protein EE612_019210 [Oryza sativa]BAG91417.1 unnamed protein product [Oryza sativa Japonica Group]BAS85456.1 Os03g0643900 [Oryza sativa Japonica Group]